MFKYLYLYTVHINVSDSYANEFWLWQIMSAICEAAKRGDLDEVARLLQEGAGIERKTDDESTPLILAASNGHLAVVQFLVQQGADKEASNSYGRTPLNYAAIRGRLDVVQYLIQQGADKEASNS